MKQKKGRASVKEEERIMKRRKEKSQFREYAESIILAVILALIMRQLVVQAFKIPSGSMEQTLLIGDHILVNKFLYHSQTLIQTVMLAIQHNSFTGIDLLDLPLGFQIIKCVLNQFQ